MVVGVGTQTVGVTDGEDDFQLDLLGLGSQVVELGHAFGLQDSLVEVEQGVSRQLDLVSSGLRCRGSGRCRSSSYRRRALFLRDDVAVALAADRELTGQCGGSCGRGPVTGAPAQPGAATCDDVTAVDHVGDFTLAIHHDVLGLRKGAGGREAEGCNGGQHEHVFLGLFDHGFLL
ncbi:hypothetical protein SDC9_168021 [bioreactor metagenome]|uniref:Uncharacterized protein n=1 Tax=bioreactor metagenome TaxID=1076179 RepID=A0A645G3X0_9ZZZZ